MSYTSSARKSSTPSILRRSNKLRPSLGVRFQFTNDLKAVLENYLSEKDKKSYVDLICSIRDSAAFIKDDELLHLLREAKECFSMIDSDLTLFVQVMMVIKWAHRPDDVVQAYQDYLLRVCMIHCDHIKFAFQQLVASFTDGNDEKRIQGDCLPSAEEERMFKNIHHVIKEVVQAIPFAGNLLMTVINDKFLFKKANARCHLYFVHNILEVCTYKPLLRSQILTLLFIKLVDIDVSASKEDMLNAEEASEIDESMFDIFPMEVDESVNEVQDMKHEAAHKMDVCLHRIYRYLYGECYDSDDMFNLKTATSIYREMLRIFDTILLPTHASTHVQFVMLYIVSFKDTLANAFVRYLWKKAMNPGLAPLIRRAAFSFLSGLLARANFIPFSCVKDILMQLSEWIHKYIETVPCKKSDENASMLQTHLVFYTACETLFYLLTFRHSEFVSRRKNMRFVGGLNIGKIVMSRFNPLATCSATITDKFADIMKTYQIVYCYSVMSFENRIPIPPEDLWIYEFFPFDTYILRRTLSIIEPIYRKCEIQLNNGVKVKGSDTDEEQEDDFIPQGMSPHSPHFSQLLRNPSPAFV